MNIVPNIPKRPSFTGKDLLKEILCLVVCIICGILIFLNVSEPKTDEFISYMLGFGVSGYFFYKMRKKSKFNGEGSGPIIR